MALTTLNREIAHFRKSTKWEPIELFVDSGMIHSVIPAPVLRRLGIRASAGKEFVLPDGRRFMRRSGLALFRYQKHIGGGDVIFGEPGDCALLGALTLGSLGLGLHPLRRELVPLPMILGGWRPERTSTRRRSA